MIKLYPPSIEGKLPAFAGETLKILITMNRTVNISQVSGMRAILKSVQSSQVKATLFGSLSYEATTGKYYAIFEMSDQFKPTLGQYYKVQIAYIDKLGEVGYFSNVGTIKYTSYPSLTIPDLKENFYGKYDYVGVYSQEDGEDSYEDPETGETIVVGVIKRDNTEKIYSYCFELTDRDGNLVATSGVKLHDSSKDKSIYESQDRWQLRKELTKDVPFYLTYKVTTINGLEATSARYLVMDQDSVDMDMELSLVSDLDFDNGCVQLYFYPRSSKGEKTINLSGSFVLIRSSSLDNFGSWNKVYSFTYSNVTLAIDAPVKLWEDYTIQQGVEYVYAIQAYNSHLLYSNRVLSINKNNPKSHSIYADFEDAFLYDGERQLKIRYNPKVANFKTVVLENKIDTIGSQYPFVFRNGNVNYKEFSISGLLSLRSDPDEKFLKGIQTVELFPGRDRTASGQTPGDLDSVLTGVNIQREREFKMEVLAWLNNGKPKLFRSPSEGNYIVRLMNITMTPNDSLGRMLHTFNSTAYEIAECTFDNLINLNLMNLPQSNTTSLKVGQISLNRIMTVHPIILRSDFPDFLVQGNTINVPSIYAANITEATPGTMIGLGFANGKGIVTVEIGGTGSYYVQTNEYPLVSLTLISGRWDEAKLTFNYYDDTPSDAFSKIASLALTDEIRQFIGTGYGTNVVANFGDIRRDIGQFHYIKVMKRQIENIWEKDGIYYRTDIGLDRVDDWNKTVLYYIVNKGFYFDGGPKKVLRPEDIDYRFALNPKDGKDFTDLGGRPNGGEREENDNDLTHFGDTFGRIEAIRNVENVDIIYIGTGVIVEMAYRVRTKTYTVEETDDDVVVAKKQWTDALTMLDNWVAHPSMKEADYQSAVNAVNSAYKNFILVLEESLARKGG